MGGAPAVHASPDSSFPSIILAFEVPEERRLLADPFCEGFRDMGTDCREREDLDLCMDEAAGKVEKGGSWTRELLARAGLSFGG